MDIDYQAIRKEYEDRGLEPTQLHDNPLVTLQDWIEEAAQNSPGRWFESNAMALATTDTRGQVSVRWVLLKGIAEQGIRFFTSYDSRKASQMDENPRAAVAFHWPYLGRQIRIEGAVSKTSREISEEYFHSRPRGSQLSAAVSPQSAVITSRQPLEQAKSALENQLNGKPVPLPDNWGGYWLRPDRCEFWQGRQDRLHDRFVYERKDDEDNWTLVRLAP